MLHGHEFFDAAVDGCRRLGIRGLLLSRHAEHVPTDLPLNVIHVTYVPFSELLPRCAALVHHGGIGTTSQALRAGIRQLIMPMTHDQPDNAIRVKRLGVGATISQRAFTGRKVARALQGLLNEPAMPSRCRAIAERFEGIDALGQTCQILESLGARQPSVILQAT
jgi:UDP:flavonoid glycosyltransferase YjiC (YdhE family)